MAVIPVICYYLHILTVRKPILDGISVGVTRGGWPFQIRSFFYDQLDLSFLMCLVFLHSLSLLLPRHTCTFLAFPCCKCVDALIFLLYILIDSFVGLMNLKLYVQPFRYIYSQHCTSSNFSEVAIIFFSGSQLIRAYTVFYDLSPFSCH